MPFFFQIRNHCAYHFSSFFFGLADPRFVWNKNLLEELIEDKLYEFIIPLIQGNIQKN